MDVWSQKKRSKVMSRILSRNTLPEQRVRRILSSMGYCYRLNVKNLPGKPDIVLRKHNAVVFVHRCFWHLHSGCRDGTVPKSRIEYWQKKLFNNKARDEQNIHSLRREGWRVLRLWECDVEKRTENVKKQIKRLLAS